MLAKTINTILNLTDKFTPKLTAAKKEALVFKEKLRSCNEVATKIDSGLAKVAKTAVAMGAAATAAMTTYGIACSKAYDAQIEAETKLQTVMSQRMKATTAEIDSVKKLASSQQRLGVIGDEVQLAGAQQLSTFLNTSSALKTLLPAMNNLAVQQNGVNVTSENMVSLGNMMGKVMQGQTSALKRVGITFAEAQEKALKYGDEQQRAATLAQVITDNVGDMNKAIAETTEGKVKQFTNDLGDMQEVIGSKLQPYIRDFFDYIHERLPELQTEAANFLDRNLPRAINTAKKAFEKIKPVLKFIKDNFAELTRVGIGLVAGLKTFSILTKVTTYYKKFEETLKGVSTAQKLATVAQTAFSTSLLASPITLIAAAVGGVTAAYLAFKKHLEKKDIEKHFGDITLSAEECQKMVEGVFGSETINKVNEVSEAYEDLKNSLDEVSRDANKVSKLNFKIDLGAGVEGDEYMSAINQYVEDIQKAVQDKQYSLKLNMNLLLGSAGGTDEKLNTYMAEFSAKGTELGNALTTAANNYINKNFAPDFKKPLDEAFQAMQEYQEKLNIAQSEAKLKAAKTDFASGDLSEESFKQLMETTNEEIAKMKETYNQARIDAIAQYQMAFNDQEINLDELNKKIEEINTKYRENMSDLEGKGLQFEASSIMEAYQPEFQAALDKFGQDIDFTGFYDSIATELANGGTVNWENISQRLFDDFSIAANETMSKASRKNIKKLFELIEPTGDELEQITEGMKSMPEAASNAFLLDNVIAAASNKARKFRSEGFTEVLRKLDANSDGPQLQEGSKLISKTYSEGLVSKESLRAAEDATKRFKDYLKSKISEPMSVTVPVTVTATPTVDGSSPTAKKTDSNATGTAYFGGGWTRVNENGGEIMKLPTGTSIIPADKSAKLIEGLVGAKNAITDKFSSLIGRAKSVATPTRAIPYDREEQDSRYINKYADITTNAIRTSAQSNTSPRADIANISVEEPATYFGGGWLRNISRDIGSMTKTDKTTSGSRAEGSRKESPDVNVSVNVQGNIFGLENAADIIGDIVCGRIVEAVKAV